MREHLRFLFLCFLPAALVVGLGLWALTGDPVYLFVQAGIVICVLIGAWLTWGDAHEAGYAEGYTDAWVEAAQKLEGWDE